MNAAQEKKVRENMVAVATEQGFVLPEGFLTEGAVVQNTETGMELWLCGCGKFVKGEIGGNELHNHYNKGGYRLRRVGKQRTARCGVHSGVLAERERVAQEKAAAKAAKVAVATEEVAAE